MNKAITENQFLKNVDFILNSVISTKLISPLQEAAYYMLSGGKKIRPSIIYRVLRLIGKIDPMLSCTYAACIELLHVASLIHDDLPSLDNDDLRRGRPTCHIKFGEPTALLLGDLLVPLAFELLIENHDINTKQKLDLVNELASAYRRLCIGQRLDIELNENVEKIIEVHQLKTGAIFGACSSGAAILSEMPVQVEGLLREWGLQLGVIFQAVDDLVDRFGNLESRGRNESSDKKNTRTTSVIFLQINNDSSKTAYLDSQLDKIGLLEDKLSEFSIIGLNELYIPVLERNPFYKENEKKQKKIDLIGNF